MRELVHSISTLCKLLHTLTGEGVRPELFRLAKLNKLTFEETQSFWNVLHKLCCFSTNKVCQNDSVQCVSRYLVSGKGVIGYALPPDSSPRQLLLCFSWLLSQGVLETIIDQIVHDSPLGDEFPSNVTSQFKSRHATNIGLPKPLIDPRSQLKYIACLMNDIERCLKAISTYRQEKVKLNSKIHKLTSGVCGLSHLSAGDLYLLTNPDQIPEFVSKCEHCLQALNTYLKWNERSSIFWKWMDSILEEEESVNLNRELSERELSHLHNFLKSLEQTVRRTVRSEEEEMAREVPYYCNSRLLLCKDGRVLDSINEQLDSKIDNLTLQLERKKQDFNQLSCGVVDKLVEQLSCSVVDNGEQSSQDVTRQDGIDQLRWEVVEMLCQLGLRKEDIRKQLSSSIDLPTLCLDTLSLEIRE